jgi:hypothetical protein
MTRSHKTIVFLMVVGMGVYGCAKSPGNAGTGKNSSQEAKAHRWEEDYRAAAAARDDYRQKLIAAEERQTQLLRQLDQERIAATNERDTLKAEIRLRLAERDSLQTQYDGFRKGLKDLLAQAETTLANPNLPNIPTIPVPPTSTAAPALIGSQPSLSPTAPTVSTLSN